MASTPPPASSPSPTPIPPFRTVPLKPTTRRHRLRWWLISIGGLLLVVVGIGGWLAYRAIAVVNTQKLDGTHFKLSFFQQLTHIVTSSNSQLQGEGDDRINVLLMGIGGPGHDGPYLTDTMMVISYQPSTNSVAMISVPRDLVVNIPDYGYRKINSVLSIGRDRVYPGGGEALVVKVMSDVLNIPLQYYARVDFAGFKDIIDRVGGVNVDVENSFADYEYPTENFGYQTIRFTKGVQLMNGDTALKYSRSRHGNNGEGSDFARAKRQQKVLVALREKLLCFGTISNPKKVSDILGAVGSHSQTNMEVWEMLRLAKLAGGINSSRVITRVFDDSANGFLRSATGLGGAYILVPRATGYSDMQFLIQNIFSINAADHETAGVIIANASKYPTISESTRAALAAFGLTILKVVPWTGAPVAATTIIDASAGQFPQTTSLLMRYRRAQTVSTPSVWADQTSDQTIYRLLESSAATAGTTGNAPSLILILGQDQPKDGSSLNVPTQPKTNTNAIKNSNTNKSINANSNTNTKKTNTNAASNTNAGGTVHALTPTTP